MKKDQTPPPVDPDDDNVIIINPAEAVLGGGLRGEVAGCPTGCSIPTRRQKTEKDEPAPERKGEGNERK